MVVLPWMFPPLALEVHSGVHIKEKNQLIFASSSGYMCCSNIQRKPLCEHDGFHLLVARVLRLISNIQHL